MTLSVIIPNYNNEKFLNKCLDSVLSQSVKPDEIIIVDDCSSDSSKEIIDSFASSCDIIKPVFLDNNLGVSHARNIGIREAKGEYITTLDADDFYYNNKKLENEMKLVSQKGENTVAYSKIVYSDEQDNIIRYLDYPEKEYFQGNIYIPLLAGSITRTLMRDCVYSKKAAVEAGMYDENLSLFEDYDFLIKLSEKLNFYCTFEYGTAYRQKAYGLSHRSADELISAKNSIIKNHTESLNQQQIKMLKKEKLKKSFNRISYKLRGE